jgi:phage regulator Rha-like protein
MDQKKELTKFSVGNTSVAQHILILRDKQVMLDRDLATLYGVETKVLNQAVKRNQERFPERNCFQLDNEEYANWRSQFVTSNADKKGLRRAPYAFTEQGVAMLASVLRSDTAIRVSLQIMDAFVEMRHYLMSNRSLIGSNDLAKLSLQTERNTNDIAEIKRDMKNVMSNFIDPTTYKHFLIFNGQKLEADIAYTQIYSMAKKSIIIVDDYVGVKTLDLLRGVAKHISVKIYSDEKGPEQLTKQTLNDFRAVRQDVTVSVGRTRNKFHDRYVFLDYGSPNEKLFHCGASSKDAGNKITTIMQIECPQVYHTMIEELIDEEQRAL